MTTAVPESWDERCLITVFRDGDEINGFNFHAYTEDITGLDFGDKDIEGVPLTSGGRIAKPIPMADETVTMKVYPTNTDLADGGFVQLFHPQGGVAGTAASGGADDIVEPFVVTNTTYRIKHMVAFLWSTNLPTLSATVLPQPGAPSYRIQVINAYMTSLKPNYDDKIKSAELSFKWVPFDRDGTGNKREESTTGATAQLSAPTNSATSWS